MFEKDLRIAYLLDFYGDVLTERKKEVLDMYYNEDLSLAEIAEQIGISRQGVHDAICRTEAILNDMEKATGCVARLKSIRLAQTQIEDAAKILLQHEDPTVRQNAERILAAVSTIKE